MGMIKKKIRVTLKRRDPKTNGHVSFEFEMELPDNNGVVIEHAVNCNIINHDPNILGVLRKADILEEDILAIQIVDPRFS